MADVRLQKKMGVGRHASAMKRHRQSEKRRIRNRHVKSMTKTAIKNARTAIASGDKEKIPIELKKTISIIYKAASKGVIPKKRAARLVSRISKAANNALA